MRRIYEYSAMLVVAIHQLLNILLMLLLCYVLSR